MKTIVLIITVLFLVLQASVEADPNRPDYNDPVYHIQLTKDIVYGLAKITDGADPPTVSTINLLLDAYTPVDNNTPDKPAVVLIHGGGFRSGDKTHPRLTGVGRYLVEHGFVCFSINYRLKRDFPPADPNFVAMVLAQQSKRFNAARTAAVHAAFVDTKRAIRWVRANCQTYQIDPNRIFVLGGSAGAFCAVTAAITDPNDFFTDLPTETPDPLNNPNESSAVQGCVDLWGGARFTHGEFDPADPPIMILHGTDDPAVPFYMAEQIRDGCIAAGISYEFYPIEGGEHGLWNVTVNGKTLKELVLAFFKKHVPPSNAQARRAGIQAKIASPD